MNYAFSCVVISESLLLHTIKIRPPLIYSLIFYENKTQLVVERNELSFIFNCKVISLELAITSGWSNKFGNLGTAICHEVSFIAVRITGLGFEQNVFQTQNSDEEMYHLGHDAV
jgi:hypothetical protein